MLRLWRILSGDGSRQRQLDGPAWLTALLEDTSTDRGVSPEAFSSRDTGFSSPPTSLWTPAKAGTAS